MNTFTQQQYLVRLSKQKHVTMSGCALCPTPEANAHLHPVVKICGSHFILISNLIVLSFKLEENQRARLLLFLFGSLIRCTLNTASE